MVVGSKHLIAVDIFRHISVLLPNDGSHSPGKILRTPFRGIGEHLAGVVRSGIGHLSGRLLYGNEAVVRRFLSAVSGIGEPSGIAGRDGLAVVRDLHALLRYASV